MNIKELYSKVSHVVNCASLYLGATAIDWLSSLHLPKGFEETNAFSRHADGRFWPLHALVTDSFNTFEVTLISWGAYVGCRILSPRLAKFAAGLPWLYFAYVHLDAAFTNVLYGIPGLYVHTTSELLRQLLGR
jgi:hypothetical protein